MFYQEVQKSYIDQKGSFLWLQNGALTFNEERLLVAAQDQGIMTNGLKKYVNSQMMTSADFVIKKWKAQATSCQDARHYLQKDIIQEDIIKFAGTYIGKS